jgi:integrase
MASIKRIGTDSFDIPIWEAVYRRSPGGKQIRRRFHMLSKANVERAILLDCQRSEVGLKWSEGAAEYVRAKKAEGVGARSIENVERAVKVFVDAMGDMEIEGTTDADMKHFMQIVSTRPTWSGAVKKYRVSGAKVANEYRLKLLTIARYLQRHTTMLAVIPFEHVPPVPTRAAERSPIPTEKVASYLEALPGHVRRPVMMVLFYGLRSSAVCDLLAASVKDGNVLEAVDKGGVRRRIPIDGMLSEIIRDAGEFRERLLAENEAKRKAKPDAKPLIPDDNLFLNARGRAWTRYTLLHAAQKAWVAAGLERKKIHEVRHTLGTLAGRNFAPGMVQAVMGHRSRKSAEAYFHPTEEMGAEVRERIITELSQSPQKTFENSPKHSKITYVKDGEYTCPLCHGKVFISKE